MAVSVNTVYKTVLYILSKEQRGYVTPAEFNSIGTMVQQEIFNSYFPDGNQVNRQNQNNSGNDTEFFDMFKDIAYKLHPFEKETLFTYDTVGDFYYNNSVDPVIYKIGEVITKYSGQPQYSSITQLTSRKDFDKISRSKLTAPTKQYPLFTISSGVASSPTVTNGSQLILKISPNPSSTGDSVLVNCINNPVNIIWDYSVGSVGQYIFLNANQTNSSTVDFQLDVSEQNNLIINILKYFGVVINDPTIIDVAAQEAQATEINLKS